MKSGKIGMEGISPQLLKRKRLSNLEKEHSELADEILAELVHEHNYSFSKNESLYSIYSISKKLNRKRKKEKALAEKIDALLGASLGVDPRGIRHEHIPAARRTERKRTSVAPTMSEDMAKQRKSIMEFIASLPSYAKRDAKRVLGESELLGEYTFRQFKQNLIRDGEGIKRKADKVNKIVEDSAGRSFGMDFDEMYETAGVSTSYLEDAETLNAYFYGGDHLESVFNGLAGHLGYLADFVGNGLTRKLPYLLGALPREDRLEALEAVAECAKGMGGKCGVLTTNFGELAEFISGKAGEWRLQTLSAIFSEVKKAAKMKEPPMRIYEMVCSQKGLAETLRNAGK